MKALSQLAIFGFVPFQDKEPPTKPVAKNVWWEAEPAPHPTPPNSESQIREKNIADLCSKLGIDAGLRGSMRIDIYTDNLQKIVEELLQREVERSK